MLLLEISKNGLNFIADFEGCYTEAYQDSGGVWTIGYGHTGDVKRGDKITKAQALKIFKDELKNYYPKGKRSQQEFDALTSYHFNAGNGASEILRLRNKVINDAKGNRLKGLIRRRIAENVLCYENVYDNNMSVLSRALARITTDNFNWYNFNYPNVLYQWACSIILNDYNIDKDGLIGEQTFRAIKEVQKILNVDCDGLVGKNTRRELINYLKARGY